MITQDTAARIWNCYREIGASEKLLADMTEVRDRRQRDRESHPVTLPDAFGRERGLQLGIPSGESSHRILDVSPELGESVIKAHIANKRAELVEANEQARIEISKGEV